MSSTVAEPGRATPCTDEPRVAAWDRRVDWWLTGLALLFLVGYAWSVLDRGLGPAGRDALEVVLTGTWVLFGLDYLIRLWLAERKLRFVCGTCSTWSSCCCRCSGSCARCGWSP